MPIEELYQFMLPKIILKLLLLMGTRIPNVELAIQEGYSTATEQIREMGFGAGMGL